MTPANSMRHVDLCSGIGGFALGFEWAKLSKPALFCDIEPWSRQILAKHWPDVPIADDVKELARDPGRLVPDHDIITAGYPCQPFSMAGHRRGIEDDRHIWPEIFAIVQAKRPRWCVFENVFGHVSMGLDQVLSDLEGENYTCQAFIIPACALDAPHRRDRIWIVANANSITDAINRCHKPIEKESPVRGNNQSRSGSNAGGITGTGKNEADDAIHEQRGEQPACDDTNPDSKRPHRARQHQHGNNEPADRQKRELGQIREILAGRGNPEIGGSSDVADASSLRRDTGRAKQSLQRPGSSGKTREIVADTDSQRGRSRDAQWQDATYVGKSSGHSRHHIGRMETWLPEPPVGRVAHGIPGRVDRLRGLGNAIVPQVAMQIGLTIRDIENGTKI